MVVNKKSRQQMHEDLHLFLEKCTTPFVDWLHDQVLKKLQKVTVAKKKTLREFVPMVVVKQEEEKKKRKTSTTSFLEDQAVTPGGDKSTNKNTKDDKTLHKQAAKSSVSSQKLDTSQAKTVEKPTKTIAQDGKPETGLVPVSQPTTLKKPQQIETESEIVIEEETQTEKTTVNLDDSPTDLKADDAESRTLKRPLDAASGSGESSEKKPIESKRIKISMDDEDEDNAKKLKSCVNKPKITSVVSVKHRLGIISPRKKFEVHREKAEAESRYRQNEKRFEKNRFGGFRDNTFQRGRTFDADDRSRRNRETELKYSESEKMNDIKNRLGNAKNEKPKITELREKISCALKPKASDKLKGTIKDRLGITNVNRSEKEPRSKSQESVHIKIVKSLGQDRDTLINNKTIKNRLGPVKSIFRPLSANSGINSSATRSQSTKHEDSLKSSTEEELDNDPQSPTNTGSIKSHIIAVNKLSLVKTDRKRLKPLKKVGKELSSDVEEDLEDAKIPSKVIVTPRPLKPLQPTQKRATQSLLLRAVAEANQSVVTQKNPEPSLLDKKPVLKHLKPAIARDVGQNLSVHFNSKKRLVMEKIQVELNTDVLDTETNAYVTQPVTEEHMGVVMSLFQRSDDNQKFLVTLNGYNNNFTKEKALSDDEERLEMEVNADDEVALLVTQNDTYVPNESESTVFRITDLEDDDIEMHAKERTEENNENCNIENVEKTEEVPRKRRKLSPIVYNRSQSTSPAELKTIALLTNSILPKNADKKPVTSETATPIVDKSREKCRYWPNCTSGSKCAYMHPPVVCSAFPACKFRDKCAYKHPKCKFGLSCTKLGCAFSHPAQQCKYHPFCTKPGCPYGHPPPQSTAPVEATTQRAKFTWRRRD